MSIDFILPDIGEGIVECELVEWLVAEGEMITEDQPVADVMTDKALVQIPAMHSGKVDKLYYAKGDIAKVHQPLFAMTPVVGSHSDPINNNESHSDDTQVPETCIVEQDISVASGTTIEDFILPDIGEGIVECELVEWLVAQGDVIEEDQPIADVMTDKALVQIPAMHSGKVVKLYVNKGDVAQVHAPLFAVEIAATPMMIQDETASLVSEKAKEQAVETIKKSVAVNQPRNNVVIAANKIVNKKAVASPAVRRVARELNIDIHQVAGSGKKGRIYKEDILAFNQAPLSNKKATVALNTTTKNMTTGGTRVEAIRGIKAAMAKSMVNAVSTIPHFTYCEEIDMTHLIKLRSKLKEVYAKEDFKLTMMPFFMKAMSLALKEFPLVNSQVNDNCTELTYFDDHNIGMAVDSKVGLLVPNVKQVQSKSIIDLAIDITRLTNDARSGRVSAADLKGGTITISNIGAIGGTVATPIINKPEAAIVALGKLQKLPRFNDNGEVEARTIMQVSWSGDHRIIDGGTIARFCNLWKGFLEEPKTMLAHMS